MLEVRVMSRADIPLGMRLKEHAGWNQTEADWRRYLELEPDGCFVASLNGEPVATLTSCVFGSVAWIAMVLVDVRYRGRGIGSDLMRHALAFLDGRGVGTVRLDATPLGQPLYQKFGFEVQYSLHRYEGSGRTDTGPSGAEPVRGELLDQVLAIDRMVTQTDRRKLLVRLAGEFPDAMHLVCKAGRVDGSIATRPGAHAVQIGPCVATETAGPQLLNTALGQCASTTAYIDIPTVNQPAIRWAESAGLSVQRQLVRMCRGQALQERVSWLWASSGPEMG